MATKQFFFTGIAAPTTTPANSGSVFVDTTGGRIYFATGTGSSSDWDLMPVNISEITQDADLNQQGVRSLINAMALDFQASAELVINTGAVTQTQSLHSIDTQSDSAADDLDTVTIATDKNVMFLKLENAARVVTIKHGTGNFALPDDTDIIMVPDALYQFIYDGANCIHAIGSSAGAGSGDVTGPASAVDDNLPTFNGTSGKTLQDSGVNISAVTANTAKVTNVTTNLTTTQTPTTVDVLSSDGTDATLPQAIAGWNAGVMSGADKTKVDGSLLEAGVSGTVRSYTKQQNFGTTTLSDGANISWDLADNQVSKVTLAGNRTLDNPTNMVDGGTYILRVIQDATGTRTLAYGSAYKFPNGDAPVLSTTAADVDFITFISDGTSMFGVFSGDFS